MDRTDKRILNNEFWGHVLDHNFRAAKNDLQNGADINHQKGTTLIDCIKKNDLDAVNFLIENKAKLKFSDTYPLTESIRHASDDMTRLLVQRGANVQENDNMPIRTASDRKNFDMVRFLHKHGATISHDYDHIIKDATEHSLEALEYCFENSTIKNPANVINNAAEQGRTDCLAYLIEKRLPLDGQNPDGSMAHNSETPLYLAAIAGHADKIELLVKHGVNPNNQQALQGAINNGHLEATKALVELGADPTMHNDNALYHSITWGQDAITNYLIAEHKMPVRPETRQWIAEKRETLPNAEYAFRVLEKRDVNERLHLNLQGNQSKKQTMKI
ncbi:TPA: ankyrin repeat domain-containing protein [Serratia marcescens]|uniref:Ankyrin repeat domain-containing protein n=1 Tax=Serratia nevei TaxID=2703794 RepID=A0ABT7G6I9_9GAMM|nr:ankyrin repeat domain-containing protein [Serratia nevei]HAU4290882.1 hypothetical protein [Serratia marcescens]MDK5169053.1 ankyrin repeat domain-containing protein [Serratia nevei]MDK5298547.1 ankyrin repeat domain-containing protein [Serratia nevei]MEC5887201.1 ankyrin repeat domain-containing protein [Serratia nevei]HAU4297464.1 hypothetical protein [Serratia marcescens]